MAICGYRGLLLHLELEGHVVRRSTLGGVRLVVVRVWLELLDRAFEARVDGVWGTHDDWLLSDLQRHLEW